MAKRAVGTKLKIGLNYVAGLTNIGGIAKKADTLDTTTLDNVSQYRTFTGSWKDGGEVSLSGYFEPGDTGQLAMDAAFESGIETAFQILFPATLGASWSFNAVVTAFSTGAALADLVSFDATVKVSGKPVLNTVPSGGLTALALTAAGGALTPVFANTNYEYTYSGVTATTVTITATAAAHTLKLYIDGVYLQDLTTAVASQAIALVLNKGKKLTVAAQEDGKTEVLYEVVVVKTA